MMRTRGAANASWIVVSASLLVVLAATAAAILIIREVDGVSKGLAPQ